MICRLRYVDPKVPNAEFDMIEYNFRVPNWRHLRYVKTTENSSDIRKRIEVLP